jgi:FkbM family methyltransferase
MVDPSGFYKLTAGNRSRFFVSPKNAQWGYWNGISNRGDALCSGYFLNEIQFHMGDLIVDCGAQIGDLNIHFENLGVSIEYIGFEPSVREFECLSKNVYPHKVFNMGLWKQKEILEFYVSSLNADSSFIEPKKFSNKILIPVDRLDNLIQRKIRLFKLEAEGAEIEVLIGCEKILKNIAYIAVDCGFERGITEENTYPDVINFLLSRGFQIIRAISPSGRNTVLFKNLDSTN